MRYPFGHLYGKKNLFSPVAKQNRHTKAVSHLNNILNVSLNLKENLTHKRVFALKIHQFKLLKSVKGGEDVFRAAVLRICFKLSTCLFCNTRDTSVIFEKRKIY